MNSQSSYLFPNERFDPEERPVMKIQDSDVYSENHFGSHLLGTGGQGKNLNCLDRG